MSNKWEDEKVYSCDGETFNNDSTDEGVCYQGTAKSILPSELLRNSFVSELEDTLVEALYDEVGEVACGAIFINEEDAVALHNLVGNFLDAKIEISCYKVVDIEEV